MLLRYDRARMQALLQSFYMLAKIRIVVFNDAFEKVAEYPEQDSPFCSLIRQDRRALGQCLASDICGFEQCRAMNRLITYTCHAGLTETVTPIRHDKLIIGYMMFGQVLQCEDRTAQWQVVRENCRSYSPDEAVLQEKYDQITLVNPDQVHAAANILEACASYLWLQRAMSLRDNDLPERIYAHLAAQLSGDLSIAALCRVFGISRSKLYQIAGDYFGKGIEPLVRQLRVERAKVLLLDSTLTVSEVALQVGYPDYNYFIKVFRKETGTTPKKYSRQHLNPPDSIDRA